MPGTAVYQDRLQRAPAGATTPFTDIGVGAPYAEAVAWMVSTGITSGTSSTTFEPDSTVTRGQFATFLWRFAGRPIPSSGPWSFDDVQADSYYAQAAAWMLSRGITSGCTSDGRRFCPDRTLSVAAVTTFLWRFAGQKYSNRAIPFLDIGVNDFFLEPSRWATEWAVWVDESFNLATAESTEFGPGAPVSRARAATFLWRLAAEPGAFDSPSLLPSLMRTS